MVTVTETGAEGVRWDLTPLAPSEEAMRERVEAAVADAVSFVERWPAESLSAIEPEALVELLCELAALRAARMEAQEWLFMLTMSDGDNPAVGDLQAWVDGRLPRLDEAIRHFELAWVAVPEERAEALAEAGGVVHDRHFLLSLRRFRPYLLSPGEERVLAAREASACTAWQSLHSRTLGGLTARFDDGSGEREWSLSELEAARRGHADREVRRAAWGTIRPLLGPVLPLMAQCYDTLVADRLAVDRLRGHVDPMKPRHLENEIEASVVAQLLETAEAHYGLGHRWFGVKAQLLGLDRLDTVDLVASAIDAPPVSWDEAHGLAVDVFGGLSQTLADEAEAFFSERRIDAEMRRGKPYALFCVSPSTRVPGFVLVNWAGRFRDLVGLTHELGHGTHFALAARAQSDNSFMPGLTIAEVPSTFAQLRLVEQLAAIDGLGRAALASALDEFVIYVLLMTAFARYEQAAYALRAEGQALTHDRLCALCDAELAKVWGDAMSDELGGRSTIWAPMPHFIHERFYTYAYVFSFLVAAGLLARSHEVGFDARYEQFLAAGGSASPEELMSILGVDLSDPGIWDDGFAVIESWLEQISA